MCFRLLQALLLLGSSATNVLSPAQAPTSQSAGTEPAFTLHTGTRLVLTDVTVTDKVGNPVHGLTPSDFRILDNGRRQKLASFEEHTGSTPVPASVSLGVHDFNNGYLFHAPSVSNIILIDTSTLGLLDQMYLGEELTHFIKALPSGEPLAIYSRVGLLTLLLQDFTSDHGLLLAALQKAVPMLRQPDAQFASDMAALEQLMAQLQDLPGRKNILWFSGGSQFLLRPDASTLPSGVNLRPLYDGLEKSRIAIYPIDARGLTVATTPAMPWQHFQMEDVAEATGGEAFFNNNGFAQMASNIVDRDKSFYTLTYSPHDLHFNNKWHKVKVEVLGNYYNLSYRRGYFDDGNNLSEPGTGTRKLLNAAGEVTAEPDHRKDPLFFRASVSPSLTALISRQDEKIPATPMPGRNEITYSVHFHLPASEFVHGQQAVVVSTGLLAFNCLGRPVGSLTRRVTLQVDEEKLLAHPDGFLSFEQQINLPRGDDYLDVAVADNATGRIGHIHIPLTVEEPSKEPPWVAR